MEEQIREMVEQRINALPMNQLGEVVGRDTAAYKVKVKLQPSGIETDWLRVSSPFAGAGWGIFGLPVEGAEVLLVPVGNEYIVIAQMFNGIDVPEDAGDDLLLLHESGVLVRLGADGKVDVGGEGGKEAARKGDSCSCSAASVGDHGTHTHTIEIDEGSGTVKIID